jgi:hypothetical protein
MSDFFDKFKEKKEQAEREGKTDQMKQKLEGTASEESQKKYWKSRQNSKKLQAMANDKSRSQSEDDEENED